MNPELVDLIEKNRSPTKNLEEVIQFLAAETYETPADPAFM